MEDVRKILKENANEKGAKGLAKIIAVVIILVVAAFGDVMYITKMQAKFPPGLLLMMCYVGAFMSFAAIGYLLLGKTVTFRPGGQIIAAWIVFVAELVILTLNILLVFDDSSTGLLAAWAYIAPATPVLHMVGVSIIFFMDPELKDKHRDMEMQSKSDELDRQYAYALKAGQMAVKMAQLEYTGKSLVSSVNSPESLEAIQMHADRVNSTMLTELTGHPVSTRRIVAANTTQAQLAQTAQYSQPTPSPMQARNLTSEEAAIFIREYEKQKEVANGTNPLPAISHEPIAKPKRKYTRKTIPAAAAIQEDDIYSQLGG